jgi:type I restriction-modification system DNA methylase subunit
MAIQNIIKNIQDIMRKDAGVDGDAQRLSQLVWLLFLKIFDDKEKEYELVDLKYVSPIPEALRWRNWASDAEGITGDEMLDFINNKLFKKLKDLKFNQNDDPRGVIVKEVFEDTYNYMKSGTLTESLKILWEENYFKVWGNQANLVEYLAKRDNHFSAAELGMALKRAEFLTRRGKRGNYEYVQKHPFVKELTK